MNKEDKKKLVEEVLSKNSKCKICNRKKAVQILPNYTSMNGSINPSDYFGVCKACGRARRITLGIGK